jgi:hypothetical protein
MVNADSPDYKNLDMVVKVVFGNTHINIKPVVIERVFKFFVGDPK